jgi:hypothetical protein
MLPTPGFMAARSARPSPSVVGLRDLANRLPPLGWRLARPHRWFGAAQRVLLHRVTLASGTRPSVPRLVHVSVIHAGLDACDRAGLPAAVETSNEANCRLYERLGFRAAGDRTAPDGGLRVPPATREQRVKRVISRANAILRPPITTVTVKPGDTLSGIAAAHTPTLKALLAFPENAKYRANPGLIHPGDVVRVK